MAGGFGLDPWGGGAWGLSSYSVASAEPLSENRVRVTFSEAVVLTGLLTLDDGLRFQNYLVFPNSGAVAPREPGRSASVRDVERDGDSEDSVIVVLDRPMSPYPGQYKVVVVNVRAASGATLAGDTAVFDGLLEKRVPKLPETAQGLRDFANPQVKADTLDPLPDVTAAILGTLAVDDQGDYGFDEGLAYLRKRVLRRLVTRRGGFYHLPDYGAGIPLLLKQSPSQAVLRQIEDDAREQIEREPDVDSAEVSVTQERVAQGTLLRVNVRVEAKGKQASMSVPFRLGAGEGLAI